MAILQALKKVILGDEPTALPALGRNDQCWCGSGEKYKRCHLAEDDRKRSGQRSGAGRRRRF